MSTIPEQKVDDVLDILAGEAMSAQAAGKPVEINPYYLDELLQNYRKLHSALGNLLNACIVADINGELADNIHGGILDQAREALK